MLEEFFEATRPKLTPSYPYDERTNKIELPAKVEKELLRLLSTGNGRSRQEGDEAHGSRAEGIEGLRRYPSRDRTQLRPRPKSNTGTADRSSVICRIP